MIFFILTFEFPCNDKVSLKIASGYKFKSFRISLKFEVQPLERETTSCVDKKGVC